jgi:hypothetical protein
MKTLKINIEKSLKKLSILVGIGKSFGWKKRLADFLEVDKSVLSNWNRRGIPQRVIDNLDELGYHHLSWVVDKTPVEIEMEKRELENDGNVFSSIKSEFCNKPRHEDLIKKFENKPLAFELNQLLVEIEKRDPEKLEREVKSFLEFTLASIKQNHVKKTNHNGG